MLPTWSVADRIRLRNDAPSSLKRTALARSITWGKSTLNGCGGTYGHFVM